MKQKSIYIGLIFSTIIFLSNCTQQDDSSVLKGRYLGQKPPGLVPEIFAEGIVSTSKDEINAVFSPDGKEFYFSKDTYQNRSSVGRDYTIMYMKQTKNGWIKPQVAPFSRKYMNADMSITHDNRFLFFCD